MNFIKTILVALSFAAAFVCMGTPAAAELKVGAAKADITPEWPIYLGGYYYVNTRSKGVHDPLAARAIALSDGENTVVLIGMDIIIMGGIFATEIKEMINEKLGIPPENVTITATHVHTGPEGYYEEFGKYPKEYDPKLKTFMQARTLSAVAAAVGKMQPAQVAFKVLQLPERMSNRHDPNGPEDPTSVLLVVRDMEGNPITGFLNMPSHGTSAPAEQLLISSGWAGEFTRAMDAKLGDGKTFIYLQGAAGNISPRGTGGDDPWQGIKNYGESLADEIWEAYEATTDCTTDFPVGGAMKHYDNVPVRTSKATALFAKQIPERVRQIKESDLSDADKERQIGWLTERVGIENFMQPMIKSMDRVHKGRTSTTVQALRLGSNLVVTFPGEAIAEVSIEMRKRLGPDTVVLGYTDDHLGYLTTNEVYEQGGYEAGMGLVYPDATYKFMDDNEKMAKSLME